MGINATPHVAKEGGKAERCRSGAEHNRDNTGSSGKGTELVEIDRHLRTKHGLGVTEQDYMQQKNATTKCSKQAQ